MRATSFRLIVFNAAACLTLGVASPGMAQFNRPQPADSTASVADESHRLLPADANTLLQLRQRVELLQALGLAPDQSRSRQNRRPQQQTPTPNTLSPQLLELLQQMAPQTLPERSGSGSPLRGQTGNNTGSRPQNSQDNARNLQRLQDLLSQENLNADELRQMQELLRSTQGQSTGRMHIPDTGEPGTTPGRQGNPPERQPGSSTARRPSGRNSGLPSLANPGQSRTGSVSNPLAPGNTENDADAAHRARQEMLRQAFGIDSKTQPQTSGRTGSNTSPSQNPGFSLESMRKAINENRFSDQDPLLNRLDRNAARARNAGPGNPIDSNSAPQQQTLQQNPNAEQLRNVPSHTSRPSSDSLSQQKSNNAPDGTTDARSNHLSEIAGSDQPAWQKLQTIAQFARDRTARRSGTTSGSTDNEDSGFALSNHLTEKLANVVQSAATATAETLTELRDGDEAAALQPNNRLPRRGTNERPDDVRGWASSVNDWIASLPDESRSAETATATVRNEPESGESSLSGAIWAVALLLIGAAAWWLLRGRLQLTSPTNEATGRRRLRPSATERERLIHAFHELIRQSDCGSEEWWHHGRAVQQLTQQQPQLATALRSLAAIYEQARYAPDSEPSPEQLAAARAALKQCGKS